MKKIAIVADWMTTMGGAEKVLECWSRMFPDAEFFTTVWVPGALPFAEKHPIHTSYLQALPLALRKRHQLLFSLLPTAVESLDLRGFDLVISSASFVAKGVITDETAVHICYCHTPTRYFWDEWQYFLKEGLNIPSWLSPLKFFFPSLFTKYRQWDFVAAHRPEVYVGNSEYVVQRIQKYYRKDALLLRPPVDYARFSKGVEVPKSDFYIACGRIIPYKKFDLLVQAFQKMPDKKLKIAGKGPELEKIRSMAAGYANIEILGFVPNDELVALMGSAKAFLFPQNEDAGITPMEALATGTPCIALRKGGALGIVTDENGIFFESQTIEDCIDAVYRFEEKESLFIQKRKMISESMEQFSSEHFEDNFQKIVERYC